MYSSALENFLNVQLGQNQSPKSSHEQHLDEYVIERANVLLQRCLEPDSIPSYSINSHNTMLSCVSCTSSANSISVLSDHLDAFFPSKVDKNIQVNEQPDSSRVGTGVITSKGSPLIKVTALNLKNLNL
ncbi:hypothetical protein RCL1_008484 [Eukaryota sp. TZLM3-RCL]